ncbi:MAG: hypothetical protein ACYTGC_10680, partial [Planctomycetota bacterium]
MNAPARILVVLIATFAATMPTAGRTDADWNRRTEAIAVVPNPAGGFDIYGAFSVRAADPLTILNLSTEAQLLVNGVPIELVSLELSASPVDGS